MPNTVWVSSLRLVPFYLLELVNGAVLATWLFIFSLSSLIAFHCQCEERRGGPNSELTTLCECAKVVLQLN